jgi:uncharacterized protein
MSASTLPLYAGDRPPGDYDRAPEFTSMTRETDVAVPMRDGVNLAVDIYRPQAPGRFPALLAFAVYNKDIQGPAMTEALPAQPAFSALWMGPMEAGDTHYFVSRGYVHVIGGPRGIGKSEGGGSREWDCYDLIEWIAAQPWCDGNVGMVGISGFGAEQMAVARQQPPHLKAIFPFDPRGAYGHLGGFRHEYPGGVVHVFRYMLAHFSAMHQNRGRPGTLPPQREEWWREAMANLDYRMYPHIFNVVTQKGEHMPAYFDVLINPYDSEQAVQASEAGFANIKIPAHTGSGWYGYTYKTHLNGAETYFEKIQAPKKLTFLGPAHLERPFHTMHGEILRWHDHWLKGLDTGVMAEPPVRYWVMGANQWRTADAWPPANVAWTNLYLSGWEKLSARAPKAGSADDFVPPDSFLQMPLAQTNTVTRLRYMTDPLTEDVTIAGPSVLVLHAAINQSDTNWIVILKDVGPDVSVQTAREGERQVPANLLERELTRGWLKASHRALDEKRSRPGRPWHPLTRETQKPVTPGEIVEYQIEILATANCFKAGHRIAVDITALDVPTGVAGATNAEYVPYHVCSSRTVVHHVHHDPKHPSHLLLPVLKD